MSEVLFFFYSFLISAFLEHLFKQVNLLFIYASQLAGSGGLLPGHSRCTDAFLVIDNTIDLFLMQHINLFLLPIALSLLSCTEVKLSCVAVHSKSFSHSFIKHSLLFFLGSLQYRIPTCLSRCLSAAFGLLDLL